MEIRTFQPQDLYAISLQSAQLGILYDTVREKGYGEALAAVGKAYTATSSGEVMACIGVIPQWPGYSRAWALVSRDAGRCMVSLTRGIARWLRFHNEGRVDTAVRCDFDAAIRWAKMLGFQQEGVMRKYDPEGADYYLYAQVA